MKQYLLEAAGTFILVFVVTGALILYERSGITPATIIIALIYGIVIGSLTLALAKLTGAHLNPALTVAYSVEGCLPWKQTIPYIVSQCAGAIAASTFLKYLFPLSTTLGAVVQDKDDVPMFIREFCYTLILLTGMLSIPKDSPAHRRLAAVAAGILTVVTVYLSDSGLNPARSLAPALLAHKTEGLWIYLTAPLCAALSAASIHAVYTTFRPQPK